MNDGASRPSDRQTAWPCEDLEFLGACPCCGQSEREVQFAGLSDLVTGDAPGEWTLWRCGECDCAYLDPRPTEASIGRAYANYHTHSSRLSEATSTSERLKFLGSQAFYQSARPGGWLQSVGRVAAVKRWLGHRSTRIRHLPPAGARGETVLDIGFGSGDFLKVARWIGYDAVGIDFDPIVVARAQALGFVAHHAGIPNSGLPPASFDHVTLGNVLEHLHHPVAALREIGTLLRPGGRLWISQPNLAARGLDEFGLYWRGLEAPRHLTLWTTDGLLALLEKLGFSRGELLSPDVAAGPFYYAQSMAMQSGTLAHQHPTPREHPYDPPADPRRSESLTIQAFRPA